MGYIPPLIIFLTSSLLIVLQNLDVANAVTCSGSFIKGNSIYGKNRHDLLSTLADKVVANGGFYNASRGASPNLVHALVLCRRGYGEQDCMSCVEKVTQEIQTTCLHSTESFKWDNDDGDHVSCLVSSSNHSTLGNLELEPAVVIASPDNIEHSKDMTLFRQQWEATVNRTLEDATEANISSVLKYYSAVEAEFTEFSNVYMLMQCTPDITSQECKICLEKCVTYFKKESLGKNGGEVSCPSCVFRWDLYAFHGAFEYVTRVPAPPRPQAQANGTFITDKKGEGQCICFWRGSGRKKLLKNGGFGLNNSTMWGKDNSYEGSVADGECGDF